MPELIATRRLSYGTRRLQADDRFPATKQDARVLVALGRARYATAAVAAPVVPPAEVEPGAPEVPAETPAPEVPAAVAAPVRRGRPPKARA